MTDTADVFAADPRVGPDLAAVDWAATPLGPPERWPQSLRTTVGILLSSRFAMWMAWGPELTFFCNDAYRRATLGRKYPAALGRPAPEVWAEVWHDVSFRIHGVIADGTATWDEGLLLMLERNGYPEETYHTFSYSPVRDDDGTVVGMLCVVSEDTERVVGERRMATLRDLGSDPSAARTERQALAHVERQLGGNLTDLPFTLTYLFQPDGSARLAAATGITPGHPAAPTLLPAAPGSADAVSPADSQAAVPVWPASAAARGETVTVPLDALPGISAGPGALPTGDWSEPPVQALCVPLAAPGGGEPPFGFVVAALDRYRPLDDDHRAFVTLAVGHVAARIGGARSYQEQQRRADELAALDRAKTAFFANVSHEFRTPLTLITGPVAELRDRLADAEPEVREELETVHRNSLRLGRLVTALLDFSRIEAGRMQAAYEPTDLSAVTAELASVFRSAVERAGLTLRVDCPPLGEPVHLDRDMWEKVVLNLLSNALKFTFAGTIEVSVRREVSGDGGDGGHAVVTVADTGVGVPAAEMPRLFERFHRITGTRARSHEGSGIGLALVKDLVALHGGDITAGSEEGAGTRFTIRLPFGAAHLPPDSVTDAARPDAADPAQAAAFVEEAQRWTAPADHPATAAAPAAGASAVPVELPPLPADFTAEATPGGSAAPRVLVADDNADMRDYLARLLTGAGYRVETATDGRAALAAVRAAAPDLPAPDLLISDVMMPGLDGLGLLAALRTDPRTASVPVLLLSARAGQEAAIEGLDAGADDYLVKPFTAAELLARVRASVQLARLRGHQARWRTALVDSLQEAFFVSDEDGDVIEVNAAFTDILGFGPEGLPYRHRHPWWPDPAADPEAHAQVAASFLRFRAGPHRETVPVVHADGRRLWVSAACSHAHDPDTGRRVTVGTFRDVTAEHHAIQRESALAALADRLAGAADSAEALAGGLAELRGLWRARGALAAIFPAGAREPVVTTPDGSAAWGALPETDRQALTDLRHHPALTPLVAGHRAGVLLDHPHGPLAVLLDLGPQRPFGEPDRLLLTLLAGRLAQGLARAHQIDQQRETALALQRAILGPDRLPPGFAVRYEPAGRPLEIGGDWYDTVDLPDGRIGIVVGDCVGHGLEAAAVMGQLRSACRALLLADPEQDPARVLAALDRFALGVPGAFCTTVFCGVLTPATGHLVYSSAGHPPGILALPDGGVRLLDQGRATPLAVQPGVPRPTGECTVPPRAALLLYTDGLVERRRRPLTAGIDRAAEAVHSGRATALADLPDRLMAELAPETGYDDDVALLLYRHPGPLELAFPAESAQLAPVRRQLRTWLTACAAPPALAQAVLVAAGEACANAVEHAHRDHPGQGVRLRAEALADELRLTVADSGRWKPEPAAPDPRRGRGFTLMRALMDRVAVEPGPDGTTVEMHVRIA